MGWFNHQPDVCLPPFFPHPKTPGTIQDEVVETLAQLEREGLPSDKQLKQLKKIGSFDVSKTEVGKYVWYFFTEVVANSVFFSNKFSSFWDSGSSSSKMAN